MNTRVFLLALLLVACADATQNAGSDDPPTPHTEEDLALPPPPDLTQVAQDIPAFSRKVGEDCQQDTDCGSQLCKEVLPGGTRICVSTCKSQADCGALINMYCAPISAGSTEGYCVPRSPMHCATCAAKSECGLLSEECISGPGDIAAACHIDCALAGAAACPEDYTCADVMVSGQARKLCRPRNQVCLDALGGFCDRNFLPQPCLRSNAAGTCTGQRNCLAQRRYDKCDARGPQYKMTCAELDPPGCRLQLAPGVTSTPSHCGACNNSCPGLGRLDNDVQCVDPANKVCGMTCRGHNYDVDKNPANGCERLDTSQGGTRPNQDCYDFGDFQDNFSGTVMSDSRVHDNPMVAEFSGTVGASPDRYSVQATGGTFCQNDFEVKFTTSGGGATACYRATIITDKKTRSVTVNGNQSGTISEGSGSYSSGSVVRFVIEKICNLPVQEAVSYTVNYHL